MKRFLLILILPILLSAQPASRISRQDTLRAYLADTIYVKNRFRVNSIARFDSTVTIKGFQVDSSTVLTRGIDQVVTGTKYWTARQYLTSIATDTIERYKNSSSSGIFVRTNHFFLLDTSITTAFARPSSLWWFGRKFNDTVSYTFNNSFASTNGGARFALEMYKGLSGGLPLTSRFIQLMLIDTAHVFHWNAAKSSEFSYGKFSIDNGNFSVLAGNSNMDSMLTVKNGGVFYRSNSSYDTSYAPVTSYTHNAPAFVKSLSMSTDYYSYVGVSQDAVLGLFSADEGDHGSTIDLGEVGLTSGAIVNKWTMGRSSSSGSNKAALAFNFGNNKDYALNTTKAFLDTSGNFYLNKNSSVAGILFGAYNQRSIQRISLDTAGAMSVSSDLGAGSVTAMFTNYSDANAANFVGRRARGNSSAAGQTLSGDRIFFISARGYTNGGAFSVNNMGAISINANENITASAQGTNISFETMQNGTTSRTTDLIIDKVNSGTRATFGSTAGTGTGNVYMDSLYVRTTLAIDGSRNLVNIGTISSGAVTSTRMSTLDTLTTSHIKGKTSAPTIAAGTGAGTSPSVSIVTNSTDLAGEILVRTGTTPTANGDIATVTFNKTYTRPPQVVLFPATGLAAAHNTLVYVKSSTGSTFVLTDTVTALTASQVYRWKYHIIE